jgi:hypothetical protein
MNYMPEKKTTTVKDQVALLEGIERHWKGYLLQLAGKVLLAVAGGAAIAAARHLFL